MGIKLHCPNGHKLNIKSFLAGKKGVCPHCGASFRIPKSEADADERDDAAAAAPVAAAANPVVAMPAAAAPAMPMPAAASPAAAQPAVAGASIHPAMMPAPGFPATAAPVGAAVPVGVSPAIAAPIVPAAPVAIDPIAEAPMATWYVRPPSGGQYGPARGDVMRKWLGEGRVSHDSLVWREGWSDWRNAGQLFPSLLAASAPDTALPPAPAMHVAPRITRPGASAAKGKSSKGNGLAIASVVVLVLVCIGLVVALVFVLGVVK